MEGGENDDEEKEEKSGEDREGEKGKREILMKEGVKGNKLPWHSRCNDLF